MLPLLQQLGLDVLDERPSEFVRADGLRVHVYDFSIRLDDATRTALDARPEAGHRAGVLRGVRRGVARRRRDRPVLRTRAPRGPAVARGGGAAGLRPLRPPDRRAVRPRLHGGHPARAPRRRARAAGALPGPVRPGAPAPRRGGRGRRRRRAHPHRRRHRAGRRPHPAQLPRDDHGDAAHQLVPRAPVLLVQDRPVAGAGHARAAAAVRDLRVLAAGRGRAPAVRLGRPGWSAMVGPAAPTTAPRSSAWSRRRR